jgi:PAS domain S-box-containing protein
MKNNNKKNLKMEQNVCSSSREITEFNELKVMSSIMSLNTYQALLESAPDAMIVVDAEGKLVFVNRQVEVLFGYGSGDLLNKEVEILLPERYRLRHKELRKAYFNEPRMRKMGSGVELYGRRKEGSEFPVDISLSPLITEEGTFIAGAIRDISNYKKTEEKIKQNFYIQRAISSILRIALEKISLEEQLERSLDVILSIPLLPLQAKGSIYLVEEGMKMMSMKAERGLSVVQKKACSHVSFGRCLCGRAASHGEIVFADCISDCHETRSYSVPSHGQYCIPIVSADKHVIGVINLFLKQGCKRETENEIFLLSVADALAGIIVHQKTEVEKQMLLEQLVQSEKLSALGRMTASVAHEIRNPLTALGGFARQLLKRISSGTKEREYTEIIISEVKRLERILGNVLTFSSEKPLLRTLNNITTLIDESLKTFEFLFKEHSIKIEKKYNIVPYISIDRDKIREVIDNLITNAVDSMPQGGSIIITLDRQYFDGLIYAVLEITDTGVGISELMLKNIFEPFYTTKATGKGSGTGLGLSISKKIMEHHGGFIKARSIEGGGTTFSLHFPCCHVNNSQLYPLPGEEREQKREVAHLYCEVD